MTYVPWSAPSAIQWKGDPRVFFGSLEQCCEKFQEADASERVGARILCNSPIEIDGEEWGSHAIAGQHLFLLLTLLNNRSSLNVLNVKASK
jgi:hypothetical protein